jgi:LPXTG-motif cell wall-anchored protein
MPNASRIRQALAVALVSLAVVPAGASAQGAGDDQYSDPFGGDATPTATPRPKATATPAPAQPAATPAPAPAQAAATATPAPSSQPQLPYTGIDAWPLAAGGALLLGAGLALRARVRD